MKTWIAFWIAALTALAGLIFWKNHRTYRYKTIRWQLGKTLVDWLLILTLAARLPALLIGWCVLWVGRPIKNQGLSVTVRVLAGLLFALLGAKAIELLVLASIFSVDLVTGKNGFLKNWAKAGEAKPAKLRAVA